MATSSQSDRTSAKYSIETQSSNIFAFLRDTFFKMPRTVQVVGWLVLLLLFVFLVLYPILGITYFHGKVLTFKRNPEGQSVQVYERGLRVHRGTTTHTNDEGEFTLAVRVPNIPMVDVEFDFGQGDYRETVAIPGPMPGVSMFNPNMRRIYHVPGSRVRNNEGVTQRFFLDVVTATKAFDASLKAAAAAPAPPTVLAAILPRSGVAHAAEQNYREPTFTLRLGELFFPKLPSGAIDVYFQLLVDGRVQTPAGIPHAGSRTSDHLTVFGGTSFRLQDIDIPLLSASSRVELKAFESHLLKDRVVGSINLTLSPDQVGKPIRQKSQDLELLLELMPPVALTYSSSPQTANGFQSIVWLDVPERYLPQVATMRYETADGRRYGPPIIDRETYYMFGVAFYQPEKVVAQVSFKSGSILRVSAFLGPGRSQLKSALDYLGASWVNYTLGFHEQAFQLADRGLQLAPKFMPLYSMKATTLAELGRYPEALALLEPAIEMDPQNASNLFEYAWIVAERMPQPTVPQLQRAREFAERAARLKQAPTEFDVLGWTYFKLKDYPRAAETLTRASALQLKLGTEITRWQIIRSHAGHAYLMLGRRAEAQAAFSDVVDYGKKYPLANALERDRHKDAQAQLAKLAR